MRLQTAATHVIQRRIGHSGGGSTNTKVSMLFRLLPLRIVATVIFVIMVVDFDVVLEKSSRTYDSLRRTERHNDAMNRRKSKRGPMLTVPASPLRFSIRFLCCTGKQNADKNDNPDVHVLLAAGEYT